MLCVIEVEVILVVVEPAPTSHAKWWLFILRSQQSDEAVSSSFCRKGKGYLEESLTQGQAVSRGRDLRSSVISNPTLFTSVSVASKSWSLDWYQLVIISIVSKCKDGATGITGFLVKIILFYTVVLNWANFTSRGHLEMLGDIFFWVVTNGECYWHNDKWPGILLNLPQCTGQLLIPLPQPPWNDPVQRLRNSDLILKDYPQS